MPEQTWANDAVFYQIFSAGSFAAHRLAMILSPHLPPAWSSSTAGSTRFKSLVQPPCILGRSLNPVYTGTTRPIITRSTGGWGTGKPCQIFQKMLHRRGLAPGVGRRVQSCRAGISGRFAICLPTVKTRLMQNWFQNLDFNRTSPYNDPFGYEGWSGHYDLVKLNLANPMVRSHLFDAVRFWVETFEIDGLRLDAADQIAPDFLAELGLICRGLRSDFWLMGEIVLRGITTALINEGGLDSVTNYEAYKGLYSSHNDSNYFEIAYTLNRQFGPGPAFTGGPAYIPLWTITISTGLPAY